MNTRLHIGLDDTDSPSGGCTTYVGAVLVEKLSRIGCSFVDYPNLIPLNPNIPLKTRGNGAVCLRVGCSENVVSLIEETAIKTLRQNSMDDINTDPAIAILEGSIPEDLERFSQHTLTDVTTTEEAMKLIKGYRIRYKALKGDRGIIGALAKLGRGEFINDTNLDPRTVQIPGTPHEEEERLMVAPLLTGDKVGGMMAVWRNGGNPFIEADLDFLKRQGRQLEQRVKRHSRIVYGKLYACFFQPE